MSSGDGALCRLGAKAMVAGADIAASTAGHMASRKGAEVCIHYPIHGIRVPAAFRGPDRPARKRQFACHRRLNQPISSDCNHIHPGNGQSKVVLTLKSGTHTRRLLMVDYVHMPHVPPVMSKKNTIYVH